jgi:hypothetical protein
MFHKLVHPETLQGMPDQHPNSEQKILQDSVSQRRWNETCMEYSSLTGCLYVNCIAAVWPDGAARQGSD